MTGAESLSHAIRASTWLYPAAEIVHLWGIVLVAGAAVLFDLRVLGVIRAATLPTLARQLLPWCFLGLLILVPAGMTLFAADPFALLGNRAFRIKMLLLMILAVNALAFHLGPAGRSLAPDATAPSALARVHASLSLGLWLGVIACGRLIAYV